MFDYSKVKDPSFFKENVMAAHSDHVAYPDEASCESGSNPFRFLLNGIWKFFYARNFTQVIDGFEQPDFNCHNWADIRVPAHIQMEGYDTPAYINMQYPWDGRENIWSGEIPERFNPVAHYVKYFRVPDTMKGMPVYISFQGVESAMILWLNGHYVGYSEDSFTPSEFDLTPFLTEGENKLAVQVIKWSSGSWAEDQDFFRFSGIFRDVYLFARPEADIYDLKIRTLLDDSYTKADLVIDVKTSGSGHIEAEIDELGLVASFAFSQGGGQITIPAENFRLWSAEDPYLYDLMLKVYDENGSLTEVVPYKVGFRRFEMKNTMMHLNGRRIVFKGVNRHDFTSVNGRVPDREQLEKDIILMKRNNINAIRSCHYPDDSYLYQLCDKYGLYMIDENNMESHGSWDPIMRGLGGKSMAIPGDRNEWMGAMLDRVNSMYQRDKNHPAVLIWSCGNESFGGKVIFEMSNKLRALDSTRLVHYEGVFNDRRYNGSSDMESEMYPSAAGIKAFLAEHREKPFICCEYTHAMGNSCGGMFKYTDLTDTEPLYQGGFIWDFADQTIYKKNRYGQEFMAYGGDFDERPTDYNFSANGIVYGDEHKPSTKMASVKYNYQNISVVFHEDTMTVYNKNLFLNTDAFSCKAILKKDGHEVLTIPMEISVPPLSRADYPIPFEGQTEPGEYAIVVSFYLKKNTPWARHGYEVAYGEKIFKVEGPASVCDQKIRVVKGYNNVGVSGENFSILFSYNEGGMVSYRYGGREMIQGIPMPNFWRAPVDNDKGNFMAARYGQWKLASMYSMHKHKGENGGRDYWYAEDPEVTASETSCSITYKRFLPTSPSAVVVITYTVTGDGFVAVHMHYDPVAELGDMPEFGMMMKIDADYDRLTWYGLGPGETYADRTQGAKLGIYSHKVKEGMAEYIVPQECGNKTGVRWAKVTDRRGRGLLFEGDNMYFSAMPWTPHEMENAAHAYELPAVHYTVIRTAMQQMGVSGDDSWGAKVHPEFLIDVSKPLDFTYRFKGI